MRYIVVSPVAAMFIFFLLLLMAQLAGFGLIKTPPALSAAMLSDVAFDLNSIKFSDDKSLKESLSEPGGLTAAVSSEINDEPAVDFEEEMAEIIPQDSLETLLEPSTQAPDVAIDLAFELESSTDFLDEIIIAQPKIKPAAKTFKKTPKATQKTVAAKTAKASNNKTLRPNNSIQRAARTTANSSGATGAIGKSSVSTRASSPISRVKPKYPKRAKRRGIEGEVVVSFLVKANGSVDKKTLRIVSEKPAKMFSKSVLRAVARWKFNTTKRSYRTQQRLVFSLRKG